MSTLLSQAPAPVAEVTGDSAPAIDGAGAAMAACLQAWGADAQMQTAARLLPQVVAQTLDLAVVATTHGAAIADLCRDYLQVLDLRADVQWSGAPAAWQRTLGYIAAYHDPRLAFLTVAHLWQQVVKAPTSGARRSQQAREIARGALAPLLDMLGMRVPRIELEALICEECDDDTPDDWRQAADAIVVSAHAAPAHRRMRPSRLHIDVDPHEVYTNTQSVLSGRPQRTEAGTYTLNIHVLVDDLDGCYQALRWVHDLWIPIEGTLIDTLNAPRVSGYRALHTAVVAQMPAGKTRINFVITTRAQYAINMWGLAAVYLRGRAVEDAPGAWWGNRAAGYAQIMSAQPGALPERLYVFSPQGQLFGFDRGSTVVDFAYHVHSELAEQCRSFTVNGRQVEPAHVLRHLDIVELEHDPKAPGPNRRWLLAAHTSRARSAIERYLKRQGPGAHHGQKLIDERLKMLEQHYGFNLPPEKVEQALQATIRREAFATKDDLLTAVAAGQYPIDRILHRLFEKEILRLVEMPRGLRLRPHQLHLAQCCRPKPGDPVVGRVYRRHGEAVNLTVHNAACAHIANHPDLTPLKWRLRPHMLTVARIDLRALDDEGLLGAVMAEVYARQPRVTLHQLHALARHGSARIQFDLHADQEATVAEIVEALRTLPDFTVTDVQSLQLPPSEQAEWQEVAGGGSFNPYSRLPVHQDAMFFGRAQERERIVEYLRTQQPGVWLIGQKRVGKTSLLLHLKEHYLPARNFTPVFIDFQLMGHPAQTNLFYQVASIIYSSLSSEGRLGDVGAPLQSLFDDDPARRLIEYSAERPGCAEWAQAGAVDGRVQPADRRLFAGRVGRRDLRPLAWHDAHDAAARRRLCRGDAAADVRHPRAASPADTERPIVAADGCRAAHPTAPARRRRCAPADRVADAHAPGLHSGDGRCDRRTDRRQPLLDPGVLPQSGHAHGASGAAADSARRCGAGAGRFHAAAGSHLCAHDRDAARHRQPRGGDAGAAGAHRTRRRGELGKAARRAARCGAGEPAHQPAHADRTGYSPAASGGSLALCQPPVSAMAGGERMKSHSSHVMRQASPDPMSG
jgi:guanosine-3',5'-bis(diphosphate) 3'-pyrophosphohydrolase